MTSQLKQYIKDNPFQALHDKYRDSLNDPRDLYLPHGGEIQSFGARCRLITVRFDQTGTVVGDNLSYHRGICHGCIGSGRQSQLLIFSYPLTEDHVLSRLPYPKGFLDEYYTWLTTESPCKAVFLEPWNGKYLVVNPFEPEDIVLFALIMSRFPSEQAYASKPESWLRMRKGGLGWMASMLAIAGTITVGAPTLHTVVSEGAGMHSPFWRKDMGDDAVHRIIFEKPLKTRRTPFNGGGSWGGVFALYSKDKQKNVELKEDSYFKSVFHENIRKALLENVIELVPHSWGGTYTTLRKGVSQEAHDDIVLKHYLSYIQEHTKNVDESKSA
jgi:hypothetical protein